MLTVGQCRAQGNRLHVGCRCGASRRDALGEIPPADDARTVEELQRAGRFACAACGQPAAVMIYGHAGGTGDSQIERWAPDEPGWIRRD